MLLSLLLVPVLVALYRRLRQKREEAVAQLGTLGLAQTQAGRTVGRRRHIPPLFFLSGLTLLLLGLARPQMPVSLPRVEGTVILAFDVSASMRADDLEPTRMDAAKAAARAFVENQPSTISIGVVAFSNGGVVVQPPTNVSADVLETIDRLNPDGGTSLGQGIFTSLNAIAGEPITVDEDALEEGVGAIDPDSIDAEALQIENFSSAVILLLSDGENTGPPEPLQVAQVAAEAGVRIYPIGIGSADGALLEIDGFNVVTQLNEALLQEMASLTNGFYYYADNAEALQEIYETVDLQLTIRGESMEITALVAAISTLLFLMGGGLSMLWFGRVP